MKGITHHIHQARQHPHHVKKRIALTIAGVASGAVALVWVVASLVTGAFALKPTSFADATSPTPVATVSQNSVGDSGIAGAAAAGSSDTSGPAKIEVVDVTPTAAATSTSASNKTVIPF